MDNKNENENKNVVDVYSIEGSATLFTQSHYVSNNLGLVRTKYTVGLPHGYKVTNDPAGFPVVVDLDGNHVVFVKVGWRIVALSPDPFYVNTEEGTFKVVRVKEREDVYD